MNSNHLEQMFMRILSKRSRIDIPLMGTTIVTNPNDPIPQSVGYSKQPVQLPLVRKEQQLVDENKNTLYMSIYL